MRVDVLPKRKAQTFLRFKYEIFICKRQPVQVKCRFSALAFKEAGTHENLYNIDLDKLKMNTFSVTHQKTEFSGQNITLKSGDAGKFKKSPRFAYL